MSKSMAIPLKLESKSTMIEISHFWEFTQKEQIQYMKAPFMLMSLLQLNPQ